MNHLDDVHIRRFRGLRDVKLEGLGQINLIVGSNNSGKTSVLEAIDIHCHPLDMAHMVTTARKRDSEAIQLPTLDSIQWLFPVESDEETGERRVERFEVESRSENEGIATCGQYKEIKITESSDIQSRGYWDWKKERISSMGDESQLEKYRLEISPEHQVLIDKLIADWKYTGYKKKPPTNKKVRAFDLVLEYKTVSSHLQERATITNFSFSRQSHQEIPSIATQLITPVDHRSMPVSSESVSELIISGDKKPIIELLQFFDPNIIDLQVLSPDGVIPVPHLQHKKLGYVPISMFGDGVRRAFTLASAVIKCEDGILLIDELETAVHIDALEKVFSWLVKACKQYSVQLFATTHSLETIDAVLAAFLESEEVKQDEDNWEQHLQDLVAYRLVPRAHTTIVKRFAGDTLASLRYDHGQDVR